MVDNRNLGIRIDLQEFGIEPFPSSVQAEAAEYGDTVRARGELYRLVGLNAPETGSHAACERERTAGAAATRRLRQLVAGSGADLQRVPSPSVQGPRERPGAITAGCALS